MESHQLMLALGLLEGMLREGCKIAYQDEEWHVFRGDGEGLCCGSTLYELLGAVLRAEMEV